MLWMELIKYHFSFSHLNFSEFSEDYWSKAKIFGPLSVQLLNCPRSTISSTGCLWRELLHLHSHWHGHGRGHGHGHVFLHTQCLCFIKKIASLINALTYAGKTRLKNCMAKWSVSVIIAYYDNTYAYVLLKKWLQ